MIRSWLRLTSIRQVSLGILQSLGSLWVVVEASSYFMPQSFVDFLRGSWWLFLVAGFLWGVWRGRPRLSAVRPIMGTDATVGFRVADCFKMRGDLVVGTNTTFDTSIEDGVINENSVQGQFTKIETSIQRLDRDLRDGLVHYTQPEELTAEDKPYGKRLRYPIGTVVAVPGSNRTAYFVAIASLNSNRAASSSTEEVLQALPSVWEFVRARGGMRDLVIPVLGSGFSRVKATRNQLVREIIRSFVAAARTGRFCEGLTIAIAPDDLVKRKVDLEQLRRFLDHECEFAAPLPGLVKGQSLPAEDLDG